MQIARIEGNEEKGYVVYDPAGEIILTFTPSMLGYINFGNHDDWESTTGKDSFGDEGYIFTPRPDSYHIDPQLIEQVERDLKIDHDHPWLQAVIATWEPDKGQRAYEAALAAGADPDNAEAIVMCFDHFHAEQQAQQKQPCSAYTIIQAARCAVCNTEADGPFYCPDHK